MAVIYKKLFKILIDRDMKKQQLAEKEQISPATISEMAANNGSCGESLQGIRCDR